MSTVCRLHSQTKGQHHRVALLYVTHDLTLEPSEPQ